jgi:hypothetical protein
MEGGRTSRRRQPGTARRPSSACGTALPIRLIEDGTLFWAMLDVEQTAEAPHRADMNWAPLSDVMVAGTPNWDTQPAKRALSQSAAVMDERGMARGHLEVRSIVNR